jgi:2-polyprenyl-6-methoxyphenol hydroxylase-like FAD-dependent oxidoreductase
MSLFHQPNMEAYFILQCEAHNIPIYRRWTYTHNVQSEQDSNLTIYFDRNTKGQKDIYNRHVQVHCKWLIGCDGANSTVRTKANLKQQDLRFQYNWLVVDVVSSKEKPNKSIFVFTTK